ncbi:MAG TPA: hypothetical protein DEF51_13375 [Myxococcales bacterium]|nr:hypothetical protein [Myxococcales bacterium]
MTRTDAGRVMSKSALLSLAACLLLACGSRSQLHVPPPNEASVAGPRSARLEARFTHSCHADEDGRVRCWGRNTRGALGPGVSIAETPVELPLGGFITAVTVGQSHTCGLRDDGDVVCFGQVGTALALDAPRVVLRGALAVGSSLLSVCGVMADGGVECAGMAPTAPDGCGALEAHAARPVEGLSDVVALEGGDAHMCALDARGEIRCWGCNAGGQLGDGTFEPRSAARRVVGLPPATALSSGDRHVCALDAQGGAWCWGDWDLAPTPVPVALDLPPARAVLARGPGTVCAVLEGGTGPDDGTVRCNLQFLDEPTAGECLYAIERPASTVPGLTGVRGLTGHAYGLCAETEDGVSCWGCNHLGTVGDGSFALRAAPVSVL